MSRAGHRDGSHLPGQPRGGEGAGTMGLAVFLVSLGVLFAAGVVAYTVVRLRADEWPPPGSPGLPLGLWWSTALLLAASAAVQKGWSEIRAGNERMLRGALGATWVLALLFCGSQLWNWLVFFRQSTRFHSHLYDFTFYMLTGLHGLHILGGLVALTFVLWRARRGAYGWAHHAGVRYCAIYWHFLAAVWLVLFAVLLLGS